MPRNPPTATESSSPAPYTAASLLNSQPSAGSCCSRCNHDENRNEPRNNSIHHGNVVSLMLHLPSYCVNHLVQCCLLSRSGHTDRHPPILQNRSRQHPITDFLLHWCQTGALFCRLCRRKASYALLLIQILLLALLT